MYRNTEVRSRKHCYRAKAINITYPKSVSLASMLRLYVHYLSCFLYCTYIPGRVIRTELQIHALTSQGNHAKER